MNDQPKIIKSLNGKSNEEIDKLSLVTFRSWQSIATEGAFMNIISLRKNEVIEGIVADEQGVKFKIGKKK